MKDNEKEIRTQQMYSLFLLTLSTDIDYNTQ